MSDRGLRDPTEDQKWPQYGHEFKKPGNIWFTNFKMTQKTLNKGKKVSLIHNPHHKWLNVHPYSTLRISISYIFILVTLTCLVFLLSVCFCSLMINACVIYWTYDFNVTFNKHVPKKKKTNRIFLTFLN